VVALVLKVARVAGVVAVVLVEYVVAARVVRVEEVPGEMGYERLRFGAAAVAAGSLPSGLAGRFRASIAGPEFR
jgi:hypothetical protein